MKEEEEARLQDNASTVALYAWLFLRLRLSGARTTVDEKSGEVADEKAGNL